MKRIIQTETRTIKGHIFKVEHLECLEYNGQWTDCGYNVTVGGACWHYYNYPFNADLLKLVGVEAPMAADSY